MRLIAILGMPFSGTSVLSRLLAAVPRVASVGEVSQLLFRRSLEERGALCSVHGWECERFTDAVRRTIYSTHDLYPRVLELFPGCDTLITSGKYTWIYEPMLPQPSGAIVVYKRLLPMIASMMRRQRLAAEDYARSLARFYCETVAWIAARDMPAVVVSHDRLIARPGEQISAICSRLGLEPPPDPFPQYRDIDCCHAYGNQRAVRSQELLPDERWRSELSEQEQAQVHGCPGAALVWSELERRAVP